MGTKDILPDSSAGNDGLVYEASDSRGARSSQRRLLNFLSLLVAVVVLLAIIPLWLPLGRHALATLFPPPYRGSSIYLATQSGFLLALRTSDGTVRWRTASDASDGELIVAGGNAITVEHAAQGQQTGESIVARATTNGQVRWSSPLTQLTVDLLGTEGGAVCAVETPNSAPGPSQLLAFDVSSGHLRWRYALPSPPAYTLPGNGPTTSLPEMLYVGTSGTTADTPQTLTALDLRNGQARWQLEQPGAILAASASLVYLQVSKSEAQQATTLVALDAITHQVRWRVAFPQEVQVALVGNDVAVNDIMSNTLQVYDATTGALRWQQAGASSIWHVTTDVIGLAASDPLLADTGAGYVGLDPATGAVQWEGTWPSVQNSLPGLGMSDVTADPTLGDGRYYWFSGTTAFAMSSATGKLLWHTSVPYQPIGGPSSPFSFSEYADGTLYSVVYPNQLFALDGASGRLRWSQVIRGDSVTRVHVAP